MLKHANEIRLLYSDGYKQTLKCEKVVKETDKKKPDGYVSNKTKQTSNLVIKIYLHIVLGKKLFTRYMMAHVHTLIFPQARYHIMLIHVLNVDFLVRLLSLRQLFIVFMFQKVRVRLFLRYAR